MCLKGLNDLYTYDIPVPERHIGSGKAPQEIEKTLSGGEGETVSFKYLSNVRSIIFKPQHFQQITFWSCI